VQHLARNLWTNQTDAERLLWRYLRNRQLCGHKFRRQQIVGPYVVDFVCLEKKLIVELDGGQHMENAASDSERTAFLQSQEFRVARFWNNEVLANIEGVLCSITSALLQPPSPGKRETWLRFACRPQPSPARGRALQCFRDWLHQ
jgi:very-short-patch-repair endonuclease